MTDAEIDALPAGRELDALIAEEVFNLTVLNRFRDDRDGYEPMADRDINGEVCPACGYDGHWDPQTIPSYSTEIGAAWAVVEHLGQMVSLYGPGAGMAGGEYQNGPHWLCELMSVSQSFRWVSATADAPMLAICRAALKAIA